MVQQRWTLICALCARLIWTRFMQNERLEGYNSRRVNNFKSFYGEKKSFQVYLPAMVFYQEVAGPSYKQTNGGGTYFTEEDFGILKLLCKEFYEAIYYVSEIVVLSCF